MIGDERMTCSRHVPVNSSFRYVASVDFVHLGDLRMQISPIRWITGFNEGRERVRNHQWAVTMGALCVTIVLTSAAPARADDGLAERTAAAVTKAARDLPAPVKGARTDESAFSATVGGQEVRVPSDPAGSITTKRPDGHTVQFKLPDVGAQKAVQTDNGTVVHVGRNASAAVQVRADGGLRAMVSLANDKAPKSYAFAFELPDGFTIQPSGRFDGSLAVTATGGAVVVASIGAPWARDAAGRALPTRYEMQGATVVQHINTTNATYPVVADPDLTQNCGWTSCNWTFSRWYTKHILKPGIDGAGSIAGWLSGAYMCGKIPMPAAVVACVAWVTVNHWVAVFNINTAVARNACFVVRFQYIGAVSPINAIATDWTNGEHCKNN